MVTLNRGDVVLCDLNPVVGTEQAGIRPAVIIQIDRANAVSPHTIIAPFTSKIRKAFLSSHAFIPAGVGGLTRDSVLLCEQIRVVDKRRIVKILGRLDQPYLEEVAVLVDVPFAAGSYKVAWDAGVMESGMYFYRIQAGRDFAQTKKLILMK